MASFSPVLILLVAICSTGLATRLEMNSVKIGSLTKTEIQCLVGEFDGEQQTITEIAILGPDQSTVIASVTPSEVSPVLNRVPTSNMQAHGQIDSHNVDRSFLTLTLNPVLGVDSGLYSCHIHYGVGEMSKISKASKTLDVAKQDMEVIGKYLIQHINTLNIEMDNRDKALSKAHENVLRLNKTITTLEEKVQVLTSNMEKNNHHDVQQDGDITALQQRAEYNVAFRARYNPKYSFVTGDVLKFGNVDLNLGNAYNGNTGIFTAPKDGVYYFSVIALYPFYGNGFSIYIRANGKIAAAGYTYDRNWHNSVVASATVVLKRGQEVKVTIRDVTGRKNLNVVTAMSVFTGHLVNLL